MRVEIIRIGNSRGIRIPKPLIEQCGFGDAVEVRVESDRLTVTRERVPRQGWREAFLAAGSPGDTELLLEGLPENDFDRNEWQW